MVKTMFNYGPQQSYGGPFPPPPPLPPYDPKEEAPKWDWYRIVWHFPKFDKHPDLPKRVGDVAKSDDKPDWRGVIKSHVIPLPRVEPYTFRQGQDPKYWFFDTPDYADPFKKMWYSLKWFAISGGIISTFIGMCQGRVLDMKDSKYLLSRFMAPWLLGGMVFSTAAITIANLRNNKDDLYNYFLAGLVAGAATGRANYISHFRHTVFWCSAGMYTKYNAETNGNMSLQISPTLQNWGLSGFSGEGGFWTGDLRVHSGHPQGDPGRDTKTFAT